MAENVKPKSEKKKPGGVHSGHRGRVKERFLKEGLDSLDRKSVV